MCPNDERILILAPTGQDSQLIREQLKKVAMCGTVCRRLQELAEAVMEGAATCLIAEEGLDSDGVQRLAEALSAQPAWSDLPIIILSNSESHSSEAGELIRRLVDAGNVTLVERPLRIMTLHLTVQAAVRARRRQYEFRRYLQEYDRYQEQVRQTQKLESLGVLAGGLAHDFNNILTGILGNASLAAEVLSPGHPARPLVEDVVTASERAAGLTSQMLAYAGKGQFVIGPVNLSSVVGNLKDFFRATIPKHVQLSLELSPNLPAIEADTSQLEQVVMNLVINAAEAIPEGRPGRVRVSTGTCEVSPEELTPGFAVTEPGAGTYTCLQVEDDGIGMDATTAGKIFDPFFTTKFMGRGLGLAAVQGIVRGHKGSLKVESAPGKGTTFTILFPVSHTKELSSSRAKSSGPGVGHATILVVDDEEIVRRTVTSVLEQQGYAVVSAENGRDAITVYQRLSDSIDLVLLDMTMPVMNGEDTLRELKVIRPDTKVLLSSGYNEAEAVRRFAGGGLSGFIQKPYTNSRLTEKIKRILANDKLQQTNSAFR